MGDSGKIANESDNEIREQVKLGDNCTIYWFMENII
jgi:hypothetical protein